MKKEYHKEENNPSYKASFYKECPEKSTRSQTPRTNTKWKNLCGIYFCRL